jgi:small subunit ribosomal protein S6
VKFYEAVFIVRADASSSHVEAIASTVIATVRELEGEVTKTEFCGLRFLAYQIKKNKRGHYVLLNIAAEPHKIEEIERRFRLNEDIIRFLIVRVDNLNNAPSALMRRNIKEQSGDKS